MSIEIAVTLNTKRPPSMRAAAPKDPSHPLAVARRLPLAATPWLIRCVV